MALFSSIGVGVPAYKGARELASCLRPIMASPLKPKVLVVDSNSNDGTIGIARGLGAEAFTISQSQFNHGATRDMMRRRLGTDIVVFLTQDAVPVGPEMLENLVRPIEKGWASISYARQVPRAGAGLLEAFSRRFNYPEDGEIRSIADVQRLGSYTFFCSNSCCAWSNAALESIGGFERTLTAEDVIATTKLLAKGHKIAYSADAVVKHSHPYSVLEEFRRYFDTGMTRSRYRHILFSGGGDERRGATFVKDLLSEVVRKKPLLIPNALLSSLAKLVGYRIGYHGQKMPLWLKSQLSQQSYFWKQERAKPAGVELSAAQNTLEVGAVSTERAVVGQRNAK